MRRGGGLQGGMLKIEFETDNAAFAEGGVLEVARVLRSVADRVEGGEIEGPLTDSNGNRIGSWELNLHEAEVDLEES